MRYPKLKIIIAVLIIALLGLLVMQAWLIRTSKSLSQDQFDRAVHFAMHSVAKRMEVREAFGFVQRETSINTTENINENSKQKLILGVFIQDLSPLLVSKLGLKYDYGVYVEEVLENSPAYFAGLKQGDIITRINENEINSTSDVIQLLNEFQNGDQLHITYERSQADSINEVEDELLVFRELEKSSGYLMDTLEKFKITSKRGEEFMISINSNGSERKVLIEEEVSGGSHVTSLINLKFDTGSINIRSDKVAQSMREEVVSKLKSKMEKDSTILNSIEIFSDANFPLRNHAGSLDTSIHILYDIVSNLIVNDRTLEERIQQFDIPSLMKDELENRGVDTDFEWAITNDINKVIKSSENFETQDGVFYQTRIFPNDILLAPSYLRIFLSRSGIGWFHWGVLPILSSFLMLIVILSFYYTIKNLIKQRKISALKTDFINNMTHELKTPVSTIQLASEMLSHIVGDNLNGHKKYLDIIIEENKRLSGQIERVLEVARFEKDETNFNIEIIDVHSLINNVVAFHKSFLNLKEGEIQYNLKATQTNMKADVKHMSNILKNLIDNAIKYSPEKPRIKIDTWNEKNRIFISIQDNGIGISKESQKRIYDKFYRVPTGNLHDVKGFGIGLNYVKTMTEKMEGAISLESKMSEGSTFILSFYSYTEQNTNG